jgi:hypothetical protein
MGKKSELELFIRSNPTITLAIFIILCIFLYRWITQGKKEEDYEQKFERALKGDGTRTVIDNTGQSVTLNGAESLAAALAAALDCDDAWFIDANSDGVKRVAGQIKRSQESGFIQVFNAYVRATWPDKPTLNFQTAFKNADYWSWYDWYAEYWKPYLQPG